MFNRYLYDTSVGKDFEGNFDNEGRYGSNIFVGCFEGINALNLINKWTISKEFRLSH